MFFHISTKVKTNYAVSYQLGPFVISTDEGWTCVDVGGRTVVYKGYADLAKLSDILEEICQQQVPDKLGNFCVIAYDHAQQQLRIHTDRFRSFPVYLDQNSVNNLIPTNQTAWTDSMISINSDFEISESKFDVIGKIDTTPLTKQEVITSIHQKLLDRARNFVMHNDLPVRAFLSGGVDSMLVFSYLQRYCKDFELVRGNIVEYDRFWLQNSGDITQHWAYTQIHHWLKPCVLTSGAPGDEFMLRSPSTADMFLKYHGINILDLMTQQTWLHSEYFGQSKHTELFCNQTIDQHMSLEQLHRHLCNIVVNDWQHWHLGNTLTWTPLRDLEIFKLFLRLPAEQAISQIMNSEISLSLIELNNPELCRLISDQKNTGNAMRNLSHFLLKAG